jgi:XTP/dITP diphosphohydrolase
MTDRDTGPGRSIYLATTNEHKAEEIRAILAPYGLDVRVPPDLPDVVEDGDTFRDNALLKARAAARHLGAPALADDSGLAVDALGGEPGVRSARYAGEETGGTGANNALLVERLAAIGAVDPAAAFICHVVVVAPDGRILAEAEGRVEGVIRWPPKGRGGFGYDPLFHHPPSGCRLSELEPEQKNAISHRGLALRRLAEQWTASA